MVIGFDSIGVSENAQTTKVEDTLHEDTEKIIQIRTHRTRPDSETTRSCMMCLTRLARGIIKPALLQNQPLGLRGHLTPGLLTRSQEQKNNG